MQPRETRAGVTSKAGISWSGFGPEDSQEQVRDIPVEVLASNPTPVNLDGHIHEMFCKHRPGVLQDQGRCTYELLKLCLDDAETSHLLFRAAEDLARAQAPDCITRACVRPDSLAETGWWPQARRSGGWLRRRSRQFWKALEAVCAPYQFALSIRAALIASDTRSGRSQTQILSVRRRGGI